MATVVAVLGESNLARSAERAVEGANVLARERRVDEGSVALLLGTQREQRTMSAVMSGFDFTLGVHYFLPPVSLNTVENAQTAHRFLVEHMGTFGDSRLVLVTHHYHEHPFPGISRVSTKFAVYFPPSQIDFSMISGAYPRQRALNGTLGFIENVILPSRGKTSNRIVGILRETLRNATDRVTGA